MAYRTNRTIFPTILTALLAVAISLAFAQTNAGQEPPEFNMLVVGDSHISGQGLKERNKFYSLVKEWIANEAFGSPRPVALKVKAHGGSRLNLHDDELAKMKKAGDDITKYHYVEANISQPSIRMQIDDARREYPSGDVVDLVMLSGCITDVLVGNIISPFVPQKKVLADIDLYCGEAMHELLEYIAVTFPRAQIVVVGYFPIASKQTQLKRLPPYFLRIVSYPRSLQCLFTNKVGRQFLRPLRNKLAKRSDVWLRESNRAITNAVSRVNSRFDRPRVHYVTSPITPERSYGTKQPLLWGVGSNQRPDDETYDEREVGCEQVFSELRYQHYGRFSLRMCELSSVAHPNVEGSRAYAESIKAKLATIF